MQFTNKESAGSAGYEHKQGSFLVATQKEKNWVSIDTLNAVFPSMNPCLKEQSRPQCQPGSLRSQQAGLSFEFLIIGRSSVLYLCSGQSGSSNPIRTEILPGQSQWPGISQGPWWVFRVLRTERTMEPLTLVLLHGSRRAISPERKL